MSQLVINLDDALLREDQAYAQRQGQKLEVVVTELLQAAVRKIPVLSPAEVLRHVA